MKLSEYAGLKDNARSVCTPPVIAASVVAGLVFIIMAVFLFGAAMKGYDHDENLYVTAGVLIASGKVMYRDFAHLHMPLLPVIYAFLFTLSGTTNYLLLGRIFSVTCSILTMAVVLAVFIRAFPHRRLYGLISGISAVVLYAMNVEIQHTGSRAWNHSLPILCVTLAFLLLMKRDTSKPYKMMPLFFAGLLNGVAVLTRMSFVFAAGAFFVLLSVILPAAGGGRFKKLLLPFLIGAALPSLVAVYYLLLAPKAFFFDTVRYFFITGGQLWAPGWEAAITFPQKLEKAFGVWATPSYLILLVLFVSACFAAASTYRYLGERRIPFLFSLSIAAVMTIAAFAVTPMHTQYFAAPVPFLLIAVAFSVSDDMSASEKGRMRKIVYAASVSLLVLCAVAATVYEKKIRSDITQAFSERKWQPNKIYRTAREISAVAGSDKLILTLAPIFALEGGERIYDELATGPFLFRYARFLSEEQRRLAVSIDSRSLGTLLQERPPDGILVGVESDILEAPLIEYAELSGWRRKQVGKVILYVPPDLP